MNKTLFHVEILTPFSKFLETDAEFLSIQSSSFVLGVLPNHYPMISAIKECDFFIRKEGKENHFHTSGGTLHIKKDGNVLLLLETVNELK